MKMKNIKVDENDHTHEHLFNAVHLVEIVKDASADISRNEWLSNEMTRYRRQWAKAQILGDVTIAIKANRSK